MYWPGNESYSVSPPDDESKMSPEAEQYLSDRKTSIVSKNDLELSMGGADGQEHVTGVIEPPLSAEHTFPDGGNKAWMTVLGGWLSFIAGIGVLTGFAVFQSYYSTVVLPEYSADDIAWIGSLQTWGCYFFGMWAGRLSDRFGPKVPMAFGSLFMIVGTMTASVSTKYYQFVLSQGLCSALGIGFAFTPALAVQSQWFLKRRGFVVGLVISGQNVGGMCSVYSYLRYLYVVLLTTCVLVST